MISGSNYIVNLTGVCNAQYVTITLTNVNDYSCQAKPVRHAACCHPWRGRLRFIAVNHSMPTPAPANPLRQRVRDSFADKRPVIDIKLPDLLSHIRKSSEKNRRL